MKTFVSTLAVVLGVALAGQGQPTFLYEPLSVSASPGAAVLFQVIAYADGPISYQWHKGAEPLAGETEDFLFLTGLAPADAGDYFVVASSSGLSITSAVATLVLDERFTKVMAGPLVNDPGNSLPGAWGDYDNDGFPDVFIPRGGTGFNTLYHNNGDGTFTRVPAVLPATDYLNTRNAVWADYDNDGWLDLLAVNSTLGGGGGFGGSTTNILYRNNRDGTFSKAGGTELPLDAGQFTSAAWGDYDRDGRLDLYLGASIFQNFLYRNSGSDLNRVTQGAPVTDTFKITTSVVWGDPNGDGAPDLVTANAGAGGFFSANEAFYTNTGLGTFSARLTNTVTTAGGNSASVAWVDYDNDGDEDLFVVNNGGENNALFQNDGSGGFTAVTTGELVTDGLEYGNSTGCSWGDFDNDGWIDVFISNDGGLNNLLYHNNGDGTFSKIETGSPANDHGNSSGCALVDIDRDGFLDLFVSNVTGENFLYRNNGNSNRWLNIRLQGESSNRSGVGAKVRVRATIHGRTYWQMRTIAARDGSGSPHTLDAHFGLGDSDRAEVVRVEWPSGIVQERLDVAPDQFLTIAEPPSIQIFPASVMEGDAGGRLLTFSVRLTQPTNAVVTVDFSTRDLLATGGVDYVPTNGTLAFAPNETVQSLSVAILGDLEDETNETFAVELSHPTTLPITRKTAVGTIIDDDPLTVTINNIAPVESSGVALFSVSLLKPVPYEVSVDFATAEATIGFVARAGTDFVPRAGTLTFGAGETNLSVAVGLLDDALDEQNETFFVLLTNAVNAVIDNARGASVIQDDDPQPVVSVANASGWEGDTDTGRVVFTATLSAPSANLITVRYATSNLTAQAGFDFVFAVGTLTFPPGTTVQTFEVELRGDTVVEPNRTFLLNLFNPSLVTLGSNAIGTILDDDFRASQVSRTEAGLVFSFPVESGKQYRVEWTAELSDAPNWHVLPGYANVSGAAGPMTVTDPGPLSEPQRFYRVVQLP